jgi:hypothetical protein
MAESKVYPMGKKLEQLESGDTVRISGLYISTHRKCANADVWIRRDHQLPVCADCGKSATFSLFTEIKHIAEDPDFR